MNSNPLAIKQRSDEWFEYKLGKISASGMAKVMAFSKRDGKPLQPREDYMAQKIAEMLTGLVAQSWVSPEMQFGTDNEDLARAAYEARTGVDVDVVGIAQHPRIKRLCASPDGLVDNDGAVEFKVPKTSTHLKYLEGNDIPEEYLPQCATVLACSGRAWIDFASFDPRMPRNLKLFIRRMTRDHPMVQAVQDAALVFLEEMDARIAELQKRYPLAPEPEEQHDEWDAESYLQDAAIDDFCDSIPVTA